MSYSVISYDTIKSCLTKGISFAAYTLPGESNFQLIIQKEKSCIASSFNKTNSGFVFHPFKLSKNSPLIFIKNDFFLQQDDHSSELEKLLKAKPDTHSNTPVSHFDSDKKDYLKKFEVFHHALMNRQFDKLVLSRIKNVSLHKKFDFADFFKSINQSYKSSFNYLLYTQDTGLWLGASPEVLFRSNEDIAKTVALAGTQSIENNSEWGIKESEEQIFVVNYIKDILEKHKIKTIALHDETVEAANVKHLKTSFKFLNKELDHPINLIYDLHPTPAVCGIPKQEAENFIIENETHNRFYYTGFLGPMNLNNKMDLFVNLRCLSATENKISLYIGGGITRDSIGEKEWEETELKATTLLSLIKKQINEQE